MAERFWLGLLKWSALGLLAWGFVRFDFGDRLIGWYEIGKAKLIELSAGPATGDNEAGGASDSDSDDGGDDAASAAPISPDEEPAVAPPAADPEPDPADADADAGR